MMGGFTKGPWTAYNMTHEEGRPLTPEEIGEYVTNSVKMGTVDRFLFISAKHDDGADADVCHIGNGPRGPHNAYLIAAAPDMYAALVGVIDGLEVGTNPRKYIEQMQSAIAKAEGEL